MASTAERACKVAEISVGRLDFAGYEIVCLYAYDPPNYAVYRNPARVMVHFADSDALAAMQRKRLACLTPLRGQISSLIDGWHYARPRWWVPWSQENPLCKKAMRYDRRTGDAVVLALDNAQPNTITTALALLAEIKNDIISERTSMARVDYLGFALVLVFLFMLVAGAATMAAVQTWFSFPAAMSAVWTSASGGALGAFFSIAIGLKSRTVLIDLQNRDNHADALLRMLIGVIAGGMMLCLLLSGLISSVIDMKQLTPGSADYKLLLVFVIGFLAGFFERLVPNLLSQTNLGTKETSGEPKTSTAANTPPTVPTQPATVVVKSGPQAALAGDGSSPDLPPSLGGEPADVVEVEAAGPEAAEENGDTRSVRR